MDLRDFIPQKEKELLRDYITKYAYAGDQNSFANIDYRLRFWESAKHPLFQLMGQQVILTKEIDYEMTDIEIGQKITNAIDALEWDSNIVKLIDSFRDCIYRYYDRVWNTIPIPNEDMETESNAYKYLVHFFDDESFALSHVWGFEKPTTITFKHGPHAVDKPLEIKSDTKLMRALGKLVDWFELDKEAFEQLRIFISQQTNDVRFKTECCLSIHPLDYLTMSDNECGWDSCMNWTEGPGQYRLGTVEMMNSPVVIEAYVKSSHAYHPVDRREWSNKRWRCLYIVNKNIIAEVKAYPFQNTVLSKFFMGWIKELAATNMDWHYDDTLYNIKAQSFNNAGDKKVYIRMDTDVMYNDFYDNHLVYVDPNATDIVINYSGETECMCCGEARFLSEFQETDSVVCNYCLNLCSCHDCGSWLDESEIYFDDDGNTYCEWCAQQYTCECDCCESILWENHFTTTKKKLVHVFADYKGFHRSLANVCICDECLKKHYIDKTNFQSDCHDLELEVSYLDEEMRKQFGITQQMIDYTKKIVDKRQKGYF